MNNTSVAIDVKNITKTYRLYDKPADRLKEALHPFKKRYHHDFYALNDVSFQVKKGETVGILGKNGAGKSTLLKIITGVLTPSSGSVTVNGKIASLLELGAGFNPEYTGLENIYFQGSLMGFNHEEMEAKIDAILEFADIGEFMHQPVKMYSSGMFARLAFSVAINVQPEILIVDEALSVGDIAFQQKCYKQIQRMQNIGCTILLVSHDLTSIVNFCSRGMLIDAGKKLEDGSAKEVINIFKKLISTEETLPTVECISEKTAKLNERHKFFERNPNYLDYGEGSAKIIDWCIFNEQNKPTSVIDNDTPILISISVLFAAEIMDPIIGYFLTDLQGREITGTNTEYEHSDIGHRKAGEIVTVTFKQILRLAPGTYSLNLGCSEYGLDKLTAHHRLYDITLLTIHSKEKFVGFCSSNSSVHMHVE